MVELLTSEEARSRLGLIGRTRLHDLSRQGVLKSVRIGKRRMYVASSVDEYIRSQVEPRGDANSTAAHEDPQLSGPHERDTVADSKSHLSPHTPAGSLSHKKRR